MAKRFKIKEVCDVNVDDTLAKNVTDLFRNGMDEDQYNDLIKDENTGRSEKCEGLTVVRTNQLVWDLISPNAQQSDKKLQSVGKSVVKAATIITKVVNKMALQESEGDTSVGEYIDSCNDALALLGHSNRQMNMTRRDLIKPDLSYDYLHLCAHSLPYTDMLFGDDVSKSVRDIESCNKLGSCISRSGFRGGFRGGFRSGRRGGFRGGFRGGRRGGRGFGRGSGMAYESNRGKYATATNAGSKNFPKRGGSRNN